MKIFSGSINPNFASKVCDHLGCEYSLSKIKIDTFKDEETRIIIEESIRQEDCFVIQPTCRSVLPRIKMCAVLTRYGLVPPDLTKGGYGHVKPGRFTTPKISEPFLWRLLCSQR